MRRDSRRIGGVSPRENGTAPAAPAVRAARGRFAAVTIVCCVVATVLRAWHIDHGLPDLTEEAFPFRHAVMLWGATGTHVDLNPHWFAYPSLTVYLQFFVQWLELRIGNYSTPADFLLALATDPTHAIVMARSVGVVADLVTLVLVGRIARRYGEVAAVLAMGLVALAPVMIQTSRLVYADSVLCACAVAAISRLIVYVEHGGGRRLVLAAGLVGLAAGAKYPGAALLVALVAAIVWREPRSRVVSMCAAGVAIAIVAFVCTTPYVLTSWPEFVRDAVYMGDTSTRGSLGKLSGGGLVFYLVMLGKSLGWVGLALLCVSSFSALRGSSRTVTRLLWLSWLVLFVPIASVPVEADRYLVPAIAVGACLVAAGAAFVLERLRDRGGRFAIAGVVLLCTVQPICTGFASAMTGGSTTQRAARRWCESHLRDTDLLLSEAYGPNLLTESQRSRVMAAALFGAASAPARAAYAAQRAYHMVWLPLLIGGYASVRMPTQSAQELAVYPHAVDWNAAAYDIRLLRDIDYVVTTGAVRGRFAADTARFREQARFYAFLDSLAEPAAIFTAGREIEGATITIYKLTARAREAVARAGKLDTLWWARTVPASFKAQAERLLGAASPASEGAPGKAAPSEVAPSKAAPGLPLWAQALSTAYQQRYAPFADELAEDLAELGRLAAAADIANATLAILPEDVQATQVRAYVGALTRGRLPHVLPGSPEPAPRSP